VAPFVVEAITAVNVVNITGYINSTVGIIAYYEVAAAATQNYFVKTVTIANAGTLGTPSVFKRSVGLWSKPFKHTDRDGNVSWFLVLTHESTLQPTYFVVRSDGVIAGKFLYQNGSGLTTRAILQNVSTYESGAKYIFSLLRRNQIVSENADIFTPTGVARAMIDFTNADVLVSKQLGNNLHIVGGFLQMYDGVSVVEHGFHLYPENVSLTQSGTGGSYGAGTYQISCVYEWTDNFGQIHRSAPSVPTSITIASGTTNKIIVAFPTLRMTAKSGSRTNVSLVVYATEAAGTVFYRATSVSSPTLNDVTADTVSIDILTTSISNEILYTTGGVLENIAPPACSAIEVYKNRVVLGGLEDSIGFWYSREYRDGYGVQFSDFLTKLVEPDGGDIVSFGVLDDKLLILKGSRFYYTFGEGPNDLGEGEDFAQPFFVTADVGCAVQKSVVRMPRGLMLKTLKGIYLIDPSFNTTYIGAPVFDFNANTVTSGVLLENDNVVRFTQSNGPLLAYDYNDQQWTTLPQIKGLSAILSSRGYLILDSNSNLIVEDETYYRYGESSYGMLVETGWISLDGIGGFQRIYRAIFTGTYYSPHKLRISVAYDYSPAFVDSVIYDPVAELGISAYGDSTPYGSEAVYGSTFKSYQVRFDMMQQKCTAIKFRIEELVTTATTGTQRSLDISDITLLAGLKMGTNKFKTSGTKGLAQ
jgi:hypothetical protein